MSWPADPEYLAWLASREAEKAAVEAVTAEEPPLLQAPVDLADDEG